MFTPDPVHRPSSDAASWTTGNVGEAIPGVQTPLSYTFWTLPFERTVRGSYAEMGVLPRSLAHALPDRIEDTALGVFYGRPALNANVILQVGAGLPGVTSRDVAASVLGTDDVAYLPPDQPRRYPVVAVKLPVLARRLGPRMQRHAAVVHQTWSDAAGSADPVALLERARREFTWALLNHSHATFLATAVFEQLTEIADGHVSELASGLGGMLEVGMLQRLWDVAHERATLDDFIATYGYQAPYAGNLASRSWREDRRPLERALATYREVGVDGSPARLESGRAATREQAQAELLARLPLAGRARARLLFRLAQHFIPLREVGKSMYLQAGDTARLAIRAIGAQRFADPEEVFFLTYDEVVAGATVDIDPRRVRHTEYLGLEIPEVFTGTPDPAVREAPERRSHFTGVGASAGVVDGLARVVRDPTAEADGLELGEILVASATDPSWTTLFLGAAAVVVDVGGQLSHGAIVARELGIPCVSGARDASAIIRTGDRIRVDGGAGTVTIIAAAAPSPAP